MSRVLDRALRPADGPAPVRPRLPALFEPGLDLIRATAGPEQFPVPEMAGERDRQDDPEIWNGSSRLPQAAQDLTGGEAHGAEPGAPRTSAAPGHHPGSIRAPAQGGAPDRARRSTRMPSYPVRPANGTDAAGYPFAGPPGPGAAAVGPAARGSWQRSDWPSLRADSPESAPARDPARAMIVPLSQRPPAPRRRPAAVPRLHRDARQHGAGWDRADWDSAYQGSPGPGGVARGGIQQGPAEPVVRISIGRVEIRADRADAPRPQRPAPRPRQPALDLAEYLRRRGGQR